MAVTDRSGRNTRALTALMSAALALPGVGGKARAASPVTDVQADYRYSDYSEDDIAASKLAAGSSTRYEVDTHQLRVKTPVPFFTRMDATVELLHETMSGASPWFVRPESDTNEPVQVMSGATIQESRDDLLTQVDLHGDDYRFGLTGGYSEEDDYESVNFGLDGELEINDGLTTLESGVGYSDDTIRPNQEKSVRPRVRRESKDTLTAFAGVSQVIDKRSTIQTSVSFTQADGYLSDPYKLAFVDGNPLRDTRPDRRRRFAWLTRYRRYVELFEAALHADYRFYQDDWDITAHTVELGWVQPLGSIIEIAPRLRYYSQSGADFYAPFFESVPDNNLFSSDYRLAPFGAISGRLDITAQLGRWTVNAAYEQYDSDASLALDSVAVENPGLVDFRVVSLSIKARFDGF